MIPPNAKKIDKVAAACGYLMLYLAVFGVMGFLVRHQVPFRLFADGWSPPPYCLPECFLFEQIGSECPFPPVNWFWVLCLGLPRLTVTLPAMTILMTEDVIAHGQSVSVPALLFLFSAPVLAIIHKGWQFWRVRGHPYLGSAGAALFLLDIGLYVALTI